jgi:hypothetical protein
LRFLFAAKANEKRILTICAVHTRLRPGLVVLGALFQLGTSEHGECFFFRRGAQHASCSEFFGLWVRGSANAVGGSCEIITGVTKLNVGAQQEPIGAGFPERHSDTAGVHDPSRADHPVELHVGVTANYCRYAESVENRHEAILWREAREDLVVVARRSMAEECASEAGHFDAACRWPG